MPESDRYVIGRDGDRYTIVDTTQGWVKGPFDSREEADVALLRIELGMDQPPNNPEEL